MREKNGRDRFGGGKIGGDKGDGDGDEQGNGDRAEGGSKSSLLSSSGEGDAALAARLDRLEEALSEVRRLLRDAN